MTPRPMPARPRLAALLLSIFLLGACAKGEPKAASGASAGDVSPSAAWSPANLTAVKGVPVAALRAAITKRLAATRPAGLTEESWGHTQRLYKRYGDTPLWLDNDGLEKDRAGALTSAVLNANADALKLDDYPVSDLANAIANVRRAAQPTSF